MKPGDAEVEDLIKATKRGILVTRFHYTNPLHPVLTTITGMTRDGTFLVENGKVKSPIKNMRFTNGILDAFDAIEAIGKRPALVDMFGLGVCSAPAVKLKKFSFTGGTEH
jgi:predicted Zn-dependent protease